MDNNLLHSHPRMGRREGTLSRRDALLRLKSKAVYDPSSNLVNRPLDRLTNVRKKLPCDKRHIVALCEIVDEVNDDSKEAHLFQ